MHYLSCETSECTDFFASSNVYIAALDAKKAFERFNYTKQFQVLIGKRLPARPVTLVVDWYGQTFSVMKRLVYQLQFPLKVEIGRAVFSLYGPL